MGTATRGRVGAAMWLLAAALPIACVDLPDVKSGVCGNRVIDPGEDCDTFADEPGTSCRGPGAPGECRYACGPQADGSSPICPAAMGCGVDGTCRAPSGRFTAAPQPIPGAFFELSAADVDGDGRADVVTVDSSNLSVHYFDGPSAPPAVYQTPSSTLSPALPVLADLSEDGRADVVTFAGLGTIVDLGSEDRTLIPTAYPSVTLPASISGVRIIALEALPDKPGQEVMAMGTFAGISAIAVLDAAQQSQAQGAIFTYLPSGADTLAGAISAAQLDEDPVASPCDEIAFAYAGASEVRVYTSCKPDGAGGFAWNDHAAPTLVSFPSGITVARGPLLLDVNRDGHLDLVVGSSACSGCDAVRVAYGVGDGTFHSDPGSIPPASGDGAFAAAPLFDGPLPLAVGDLNGDGVPDQVTPTAVLVSSVGEGGAVTFVEQAKNHGAPWTEAVIADLNHNGIPDVLAGSSQAPNIDFFNGVGDPEGLLNPFQIPTRGPVSHLAVGDFDGDLVSDVALSQLGVDPSGTASTLGDSASILFGRPVGAPDPPVSMGRLDAIQQMLPLQGTYDHVVDGTTDIVTVSISPEGNTFLGGFQGRGDRVLRSPFAMVHADPSGVSGFTPWRYAVGHFAGGDAHLDVAALGALVPAQTAYRAWLIPSQGEARFITTQAKDSDPLPEGLDWSRAMIGAVDLDGDRVDELIALGPSSADPGRGVAAVARVTEPPDADPADPSRMFAFGAPAPMDALFARSESDPAATQSGRLRVVDVDGDGRPDLLAIAVVAEHAGGDPAPHLVVLWNEGDGALGPMTVVPNPKGHATVDFAPVRSMVLAAGADPRPGFALATASGVFLASFEGRAPSVAERAAIEAEGARLIAAADMDGDGVDDLAVADAQQLTLYRGTASNP